MSCEAISTHTVHIADGDGDKTYEWTVGGDAYIKSGQGTDTVIVGSDESTFTPIDLSCLVTDETGNSIYSANFIHERTETTLPNEDTFYIMNQPLVDTNHTADFAVTDPVDDGVFKDVNDLDFTPTAEEYPENGTAILINGNYIEIPHEFPQNEKWQFDRWYNVDGRNGNIVSIAYHGNGTASFMYGNQDVPATLVQANTDLAYTPMVGNYRITERLDVPAKKIVYDMGSGYEYKVIYDMTTQTAKRR